MYPLIWKYTSTHPLQVADLYETGYEHLPVESLSVLAFSTLLTADWTSIVEASNVTLCRLFDEHLNVYTFGENDMATARNILA